MKSERKIGVGGKTGVFRNYQPHCLLSVNFDTWANFFGASFRNWSRFSLHLQVLPLSHPPTWSVITESQIILVTAPIRTKTMIDSRYWRWEHATAGQEHYNDNDHNNLMTKTVIMMMTVTMMMTGAQYRWWRHATAGPRPEILVTPHSHNHVRALRAILYKSTKYIAQRALSFTKKVQNILY